MPKQSDPSINTPAQTGTSLPGQTPVIPRADLPPLPADFQNIPSAPGPISNGTAAPANLPPIISGSPKKKFGGIRVIASLLGVLLLIGGVGAGYILTQQPQIFQGKAWIPEGSDGGPYKGDPQYDDFKREKEIENPYIPPPAGNQLPTTITYDTNNSVCGRDADKNAPACCSSSVRSSCGSGGLEKVCEKGRRSECKNSSGTHCTLDADSDDCGGANTKEIDTPTLTPTPTPTATPGITAQCLAVTAYRTIADLQPLTQTELSALKTGNKVNFCVGGNGSGKSFTKGQFKINGTVMPETTIAKQNGPKSTGSEQFCQEYTILGTETTITVKAKIFHSVAGWVGETL